MVHAIISAVICAIICFLDYPLLCIFPAAWYMGREFAQAEYRYIEQYCGRKREKMPWYAPLTPKAWTIKGLLDWLLPFAICFTAWAIVYVLNR